MTTRIAPTKEFFKYHFMEPQQWTTTADCVDYRLVRDGDTLLIVFQQSQGLECFNGRKDWLRNVDCLPEWSEYFQAFIARGFLHGWLSCHTELYYFYTDMRAGQNPFKKIQIVCYSQGAAIGELEYAFLIKEKLRGNWCLKDIQIEQPIFIGKPRETFCLFSWNMRPLLKDARLIRTRKDIVPHLPPAWWGYRHIGKVEYLEEPAGFEHPAHIPEWMRLTYHYPEYYLACLPSERDLKA